MSIPYYEEREELANLCHEQWSGWMIYLFQFGVTNPDGSFTIDAEKVERWKRQAWTNYYNLSEIERESDRIEAEKFLELFKKFFGGNKNA